MSIRDALAVMKDVFVWLISSRQRAARAYMHARTHATEKEDKKWNRLVEAHQLDY